jgi:putative ABC transport system ATP-binding protein
MQQIAHLRKAGKTVILTSHDPVVFDAEVVDRRVSLSDGRLEAE